MLGRLLYQTRVWAYENSRNAKAQLKLGRYPDFIIVGAQKGGTTSLFEYLREHPKVALPFQKEMHFFDTNYEKGNAWYKASFPIISAKTTGESTPHYLFHQKSAARAKAIVPKAKIILLLRDPVKRAYSHYQHNRRAGRESLPFQDALRQEAERTKQSAHHKMHFSYQQRGIYLPQIQRWLAHFPKENIYITSSENFFQETEKVWGEVLESLDLPIVPLPSKKAFNSSDKTVPLAPEIEQELVNLFQPFNRELFDFLGMQFDWG